MEDSNSNNPFGNIEVLERELMLNSCWLSEGVVAQGFHDPKSNKDYHDYEK